MRDNAPCHSVHHVLTQMEALMLRHFSGEWSWCNCIDAYWFVLQYELGTEEASEMVRSGFGDVIGKLRGTVRIFRFM